MDILAQLQAIASGNDFILRCNELTESWRATGLGDDSIDPILEFMEMNPELDLGTPGSLVHFIECFDSPGYRRKLIASVQRKPTSHTVWMLNRVLNGTKDPDEYDSLLAVMQSVRSNPAADQQAVEEAQHFLQRRSE